MSVLQIMAMTVTGMLNALTFWDLTHVSVMMATQGMVNHVRMSMSVLTAHIHVIKMQPVQTIMVHLPVAVWMDTRYFINP